MTAIPASARVQRRDDLLANDLSESETVMLDIAGGNYYGIRDVGKAIWGHLESSVTVDGLCERLVEQFDVEPDVCRRETIAFLESLHERGLIVVTP
jgi:hypothetical protein